MFANTLQKWRINAQNTLSFAIQCALCLWFIRSVSSPCCVFVCLWPLSLSFYIFVSQSMLFPPNISVSLSYFLFKNGFSYTSIRFASRFHYKHVVRFLIHFRFSCVALFMGSSVASPTPWAFVFEEALIFFRFSHSLIQFHLNIKWKCVRNLFAWNKQWRERRKKQRKIWRALYQLRPISMMPTHKKTV